MWQKFGSSKGIFLGLLVFFLALLGVRPLSVPDEGRYGDISRWMWMSHDYLVPRIDGLPFLHKPPLLHWLTTAALQIFGEHVWVLRLVPLMAAMLILFNLYRFVERYINLEIARLAVMILATSLIFFGSSQYVNHDMLVACWITLTILHIADFVLSGNYKALLLGVISAGLGFLSKGLIGILIPGMVILPWLLYIKAWHKIPAILNPIGIIILITIVLPWPYLLNLQYPGFLHYFFIEQQFDRFSSAGFNNKQPWFFYIACLILSFLPWLVLVKFNVMGKSVRQQLHQSIFALLVWWSLSCLIFFSIPPSKLIGYILPMVAPLAVLIATAVNYVKNGGVIYESLENVSAKISAWQRYFMPTYLIVIAIALLGVAIKKPKLLISMQQLPIVYSLVIVIVVAVIAMLAAYRKGRLSLINMTFIGTLVLCMILPFIINIFNKKSNADQVLFKSAITPKTDVVFYQEYYYDLPWLLNLQQPAYVVYDWQKVKADNSFMELKDGTRFEPDKTKYLMDETKFQQLLQSSKNIIVIANKNSKPNFGKLVVTQTKYRNYVVYQIKR